MQRHFRAIEQTTRRRWIRCILSYVAIATSVTSPAEAVATAPIESEGVYVLGSLHELHEQEEGFDYVMLRRVIAAVDPDVMLLEVRPDELAGRKDTPGRPEYPQVIWPLLGASSIEVVPMEPGEPAFTKIVQQVAHEFELFEQRDPHGSQWWASYQTSLTTALQAHWQKPSDTHDRVTDDLARSYYFTQYSVVSAPLRDLQEQWDGYMLSRAREAVRGNPGKKVLILASYRNRHRFVEAVRKDAPDRLVDMEQWLSRAKLAKP